MTDLIFVVLLVFFIWRGATRGFLRSTLGPLSFVASIAFAFSIYNINKNLILALSVGILGPFILHWFLKVLVQSFGDGIKPPSLMSRIVGAVFTTLWGGFIVLPILFTLTLMPPTFAAIKAMTQDIEHSYVFCVAKPLAECLNLPGATPPPSKMRKAESGPKISSIEELAQDQHMKDIMNDPALVEAIQKKDFATLLSSPKIQAFAKDPALMQKILAAAKEIPPTK